MLHLGGHQGTERDSLGGASKTDHNEGLCGDPVPGLLVLGDRDSHPGGRRSTFQQEAERQLDEHARGQEETETQEEKPKLDMPVRRKYGHGRSGSRGASISLAKDVVRDGEPGAFL